MDLKSESFSWIIYLQAISLPKYYKRTVSFFTEEIDLLNNSLNIMEAYVRFQQTSEVTSAQTRSSH